MNILKETAYILAILGALNWGLIAGFNFDMVIFMFGKGTQMTQAVYFTFAIGAIVSAVMTVSCNIGNKRAC
ncbi:MAG: DUF378 domain-containing protein [Candidatus Gastranaerophilales bacterium]|nr:DUF378 domain-containing protein [Candidatus Gastranaerophilales bacterium]